MEYFRHIYFPLIYRSEIDIGLFLKKRRFLQTFVLQRRKFSIKIFESTEEALHYRNL